ncbi:MAG: NAD-dependent epimerase/dehydratase family protein [Candidatus Aminicenantes bacterium]|nr:NAD-dependent epimerase/dehydratase family protein [Candidatus Aminicenantes bacterium]
MNIIITGVAGFIGSNLAERILNQNHIYGLNHRVIGIDDLSYGIREQIPEGVEFYPLDVRSKDIYSVFEGGDCVFHLAAKNCLSDCQNDPVETADINVTGTVNVFEAARRASLKKVVYAESSSLYEGSDIFPTPETEVKPESIYGASKAALGYFAKSFGIFSDIQITGLRYFNVYGPRQDYRRTIPPVMSAFIIKLLKNEAPVIYGTGEKRRDFIYIDDVNDFHSLCLTDPGTNGKIFNIGSGKNYSILEIYDSISGLMKIKIQPTHKGDLPGEAQVTLADISMARGLGWQPKTDIIEGLERMIGYIKNEMRKGNTL